MNNPRICMTTAVIACVVLSLATTPVAAQETSQDEGFPASGLRNSVHVIPAAAFASDGTDGDPFYTFWFFEGAITGSSGSFGCLRAQALVPEDGEMYYFYGSVIDNDPTETVWLDFWRVDAYTGITEKIARVESSSDSANIQQLEDSSITEPVIDYPTYSYYVTTCLTNSTQKLYGARIWYHPEGIFDDGFGSANTTRWSATVQ